MGKGNGLSSVVKTSIIVGVGCFVTILVLGVGLGVGLQSPSSSSLGDAIGQFNASLGGVSITTENFNSSNTKANTVMNTKVSDLKKQNSSIDAILKAFTTKIEDSDYYKKQVETGVWCFHDEKPVLAADGTTLTTGRTTAQKKHDDFKANFPNLISTGTDIAINHEFKIKTSTKAQDISAFGLELTTLAQSTEQIYKCWDLGKPTP